MMRALRRLLGALVSLIALIGVVMTGVLVARRTDERPSTSDAYIQAYIVNMASEVSGRVVELNVRDNQQVKEGEVLFQIDPKPYQLSVDQARAAVRTLEAQLAIMTSEVGRKLPEPKPPRAGSALPRLSSRSPRAL
jgi:membrane fusion protein, multidrug efflux system